MPNNNQILHPMSTDKMEIPKKHNRYEGIYRSDLFKVPPLVWDYESRCYKVNPLCEHLIPYTLNFDEESGDSVLALAASGTASRFMSVDKAGPVIIDRLTAIGTSSNYLLNIFDSEYQRNLMNTAIHGENILGTGIFPFVLPCPLVVNRTQSLRIDATDLSGAPNNLRFDFHGYRIYYDAEEELFKKWTQANKISRDYFYQPEATQTNGSVRIAANGTIQAKFTVINEADFELFRITSRSTGSYNLKFRNLSLGYQYSNAFINSASFGTGQNYKDYRPQLSWPRRSEIVLDFTDLSGAQNDVYLTFSGIHYYTPR